MANKKFMLGMLAITLVLGLVLSACDTNGDDGDNGNGNGNGGGGNPFVGIWSASAGNVITFNADLTASTNWMGSGTYTYSGNTATVRFGSASKTLTISDNKFIFDGLTFTKQ